MRDDLKGKRIVGIDLGTTNSAVAVFDQERGEPVVLPGADGRPLLPSLVGWCPTRRDWLVGRDAEQLRRDDPLRVAHSVKRFIGRPFSDPAVLYRHQVAFPVEGGDGKDAGNDVFVNFGPEAGRLGIVQVSTKILARLRADAAAALRLPLEEVRHAVITVPAYFNNTQRTATRQAGQLAGWDVVDLLEEPTAAALAQDVLAGERQKTALVLDLGGGTFDVSLLRAKQDAHGRVFRILAVDGDTHLGGDDLDVSLAGWLAEELDRAGRRGTSDAVFLARLRRLAERAKVELTDREATSIELDGTTLSLTRALLEERSAALRKRAADVTVRAVRDVAGLSWDRLDEILLVGGQVLMPAIQRDVAALTQKTPRVLREPQLAVALGAARYAHFLSLGSECYHENALVNVLALDLGIRLEEDGFERLVPAGSTLPFASKPIVVTTTRDSQDRIRVDVLQGPRGARRAGDCVVLGGLDVKAPRAPAGQPRFEVCFEVAHDSTVKVLVRDLSGRAPAVAKEVTGARLAWGEGADSGGAESK